MDKSKNKAPFLTKITIPRANNPVPRPRLFQRVESLLEIPIIWLVGPPGSGKTTFASTYLAKHALHSLWYQLDAGDADIATFFHYLRLAVQHAVPRACQELPALTPEYLPGLASFTRRYAEVIGAHLKKPAVLVLDNYEQLPSEAPLHEVICELASSLPAGVNFLVLSRIEPPATFARLRVHGQLAVLTGGELNLTLDEAQAFSAAWTSRSGSPLAPDRTEQVLCETQGWIAGFTLLLADTRGIANAFHGMSATRQLVFDYFATQFFWHFPSSVQQGLLRTALLPVMTIPNVNQLTGDTEIATVLADLQRQNCFVVQKGQTDPVYEYHALFRAFLLSRATLSIPSDEWRQLQRRAARLLADSRQVDDAASLYRQAGDWPGLAALALREGSALISAGRHQTLEQWLRGLPADSFKRCPWLYQWRLP